MKSRDHAGSKNSPVGISVPMIPTRWDHVRIRVEIIPETPTA